MDHTIQHSMIMLNKSIPAYEKQVYEQFSKVYKLLASLKNNRNIYINSKQIYAIYDEFLGLLHELTLTRKDEELKGITLALPNGNDVIIDDIWQLLSLCFVTCGLIKFAPATYSSLSTVGKLLDHLKECQVYTMGDLQPIQLRLNEIKNIIDASESRAEEDEDIQDDDGIYSDDTKSHKVEESMLLRNKLNKCQQSLNYLLDKFKQIPNDLEPTFEELLLIRKSLLNYLTNATDDSVKLSPKEFNEELDRLKAKLEIIKNKRDEEGKFVSSDCTADQLDASQTVLNGLLDDCNNFINDLSIQKNTNNIADLFENLNLSESPSTQTTETVGSLQKLYSDLIDIKLKLENLLITSRWTMRGTDLYTYQKLLKEIEDKRLKLNQSIHLPDSTISFDSKSGKKLHVLILYLLRRCYALIYKLLESSEPVLESLQPIHNQLSTVRRCLLEIKRVDGLNNLRDVYPFQFKLASLDNLREDGKFIINGQIPEGQGTLNALLAECFDILHELKIELEEKEESSASSSTRENTACGSTGNITDDDDIKSDDEVELKRNRYMGFNEADYDQESEYEDSFSESEYESNDYY